jgi:hypothetical protein
MMQSATRRWWTGMSLLTLLLASLAVHPSTVLAASLTVSNCNSSGSGSLPYAVANSQSGDVITFTKGLNCAIYLTATLVISQDLTIDGSGAGITINGGVQLFYVQDDAHFTVNDLTFRNGHAALGAGGAIEGTGGTITVTNCTFSGNYVDNGAGGAISMAAGSVSDSTFTENATGYGQGGGAIAMIGGSVSGSTFSGNLTGAGSGGYGGAIFMLGGSVTDNTFTENGALHDGGAIEIQGGSATDNTFTENGAFGNGGAIDERGGSVSGSTFTGNSATGVGGAIDLSSGTVRNSTFWSDIATSGQEIDANGGAISGSIIGNPTSATGVANCNGSFTDGGYNLEWTGSTTANYSCFSNPTTNHDITGKDPLLGPLQNNGGPTETFLPAGNSPAVDTIPLSSKLCSSTDQRGYPVPDAGESSCDIGAIETSYVPITVTGPTSSMTFGATPPTLSCAGSGFTSPDTFTTAPTLQIFDSQSQPVTLSSTTPVGTYTTHCSGGVADPTKYTIDQYVDGTFTITKASATVSIDASSLSQTYDGFPEAVTVTTDPPGLGSIGITYEGINGTSYPKSATAPTNPGSYQVVATLTNNNYSGSDTKTLTISKAPLAVTAKAASMTYGDTPPTFTYASHGTLYGQDTTTSIGLACSANVSNQPVSTLTPAGSYPSAITCAITSGNYALTDTPAQLTITRAPVTPALVASDAGPFTNGPVAVKSTVSTSKGDLETATITYTLTPLAPATGPAITCTDTHASSEVTGSPGSSQTLNSVCTTALPSGVYTLTASVGGNYQGSALNSVLVTITNPAHASTFRGGAGFTVNGQPYHIVLAAKTAGGVPTGTVLLTAPGTSLVATHLTALTESGNVAFLEGQATLNGHSGYTLLLGGTAGGVGTGKVGFQVWRGSSPVSGLTVQPAAITSGSITVS